MEDKDRQDSPTKRSLPTAPPLSSSSAPSTAANLLSDSPLSSAAALPLGSNLSPPSTANLLFVSPLSSAEASGSPTVTPNSDDVDLSLTISRPDVNLSLRLPSGLNPPAAAPTSLGKHLTLRRTQDASPPRKVPKKKKSINFPMTRINIGNWTQTAATSRDLIAKCHFTSKKFVWDVISEVETIDAAGLRKQVKKIEIDWDSVLSFKAEHDCFQIELSRPPRFRTEKNDIQDIGVWKSIDHFAEDHPSSTCRRHSLFFDPHVLKTNYDKIVEDPFWSTMKNVQFPTLPSLLFSGEDQNLPGPRDNPEADTHAGEKRRFDQIS